MFYCLSLCHLISLTTDNLEEVLDHLISIDQELPCFLSLFRQVYIPVGQIVQITLFRKYLYSLIDRW